MEDIAPQLIENVTEEFHRLYDNSGIIQELLKKIKQGTATYGEAQEYSLEVSRLIGRAYEKHISSATLPEGKMYYNIASRLIPSTLDENYRLVSNYAVKAQQALNQKAGIGLKAQTAPLNEDRVRGMVDKVSNAEWYDDVSDWLLSAMENFSQNVVDSTIKANADFHARAGLSPKIVRKAEWKCCPWCRSLAGEFDYSDLPDDIYRRHENCRCTVLYDPADGSKKLQNAHTKKWTDPETVEKRKQVVGIEDKREVRSVTEKEVKTENVMREYERNARPGKGVISYDEGYELQKHKEEQRVAEWLHQTFGGDILLLSESSMRGEKRADYLWEGRLWDLKCTTSAKAADSAIRKGLKQIMGNPGGIILDYGNNDFSLNEVIEVVECRMKRGMYDSVDIIVISQGKAVKINRYKK